MNLMTQLKNLKSQASLPEMIFAVLILLFTFNIIYNQNSEIDQVYPEIKNTHISILLLENTSKYYIQDLVRSNIDLSNPLWDNSLSLLNKTYLGNAEILNSNLTLQDSMYSCTSSKFHPTLLFIPIYTYNSTHSIVDTKYFKYTICPIQNRYLPLS